MPSRPDRNVYLYGPPCVGKGFTTNGIRTIYPEIPLIGMGDYFRRLRMEDPRFNEVYGPMMDRGLLLPGLVVYYHAKRLIEQIENARILVLDGVIRSVQQANLFGGKSRLLGESDVVYDIVATYHTCYIRHNHRKKVRLGETRNDDSFLSDRFDIYKKSRRAVIEAMKDTGAKIIHIDGDAPLEQFAGVIIRSLAE